MTKPGTRVDIAFNATYVTPAASRTWTDITAYVKTAEGIQLGHGRQDEFSQPGPNTCSLTLDDSDGRFTPGLASSPYYPDVKVGRPIRVCANLCTTGDYGTFEANATDWRGTNATVARTTAQAHSGSASLSVTATTAANMATESSTGGTSAFPVSPSVDYRASAWVRTAVTGRTTDVRINWVDSVGALISTSDSANITDSTTWQQVTLSATSPSNAAYAQVQVVWISPAAGEVHYVDDVRLDVDRFVGYVDEWPIEWPGVVEEFATSSIAASSRMARMGLSDKLQSVIEQEFLADSPRVYYVLGEPEGSQWANDSSGNDTRANMIGTGADVTFGSATGPETDTATGATFSGAKYLQAHVDNYTPTAVTVECFFSTTWSHASLANYLVHTTSPSAGAHSVALGVLNTGVLRAIVGDAGVALDTPSVVNDGLVHHAVVTATNGGTSRLYLDGVEVDSDATAVTLEPINLITLGQQGGAESQDAVLNGSLAHVAVYDSALSAARVAAHADAGSGGFLDETAAARLARYAGYAGLTAADYSFDADALTPMSHIDTTGLSPVELMKKVAETDGGVLYDSLGGVLTYRSRASRYNAPVVLTLNASASQVEAGYTPRLDRSALINKVTATTTDGTYSVVAENTASVDEYGVHSNADLELATTDTDEAHAAAWWRVNTHGEPSVRAPQLIVELAKRGAGPQADILAVKVGDKIAVNNLPSQSDESDKEFFVEGWTETITDSLWRIEFNVSPADGFNVWEIGHATYGQYDAYPIAY